MRIILNIIMLTIFLLSGVSQLPACYATKLDCVQKNTTSCPFTGKQFETAEIIPVCPMIPQSPQEQSTEESVPLDRYKRLKIEQIQQDFSKIPAFIPSFIASVVLETDDTLPIARSEAGATVHPHYHPPPLFIQFQSFLI